MSAPVPALQADYYDGRSSRRHAVILRLDADQLRIIGEGVDRHAPIAELRVSEPMGAAPRLVTFPDGAYCEIRDATGLERLLRSSGHRESLVVRWQFNPRAILGAAAICLAVGIAGYRYGLPWVSARVAEQVPKAATERLSERVLDELDKNFLAPSALPATRQAEIAARFAALRQPDGSHPAYRLVFRANRQMPANAFALPSGVIILTDGLVGIAEKDNELIAVLAHELGHVSQRHGLRLIVQSSLVGLFAAWFIGDVSSIAAAAPAALLQAKYSRGFEAEADAYAQALLRDNGISPRCLGDLLERLGREHGASTPDQVAGYLDSHPPTDERQAALAGPACE